MGFVRRRPAATMDTKCRSMGEAFWSGVNNDRFEVLGSGSEFAERRTSNPEPV
jgi:hypothetical protein